MTTVVQTLVMPSSPDDRKKIMDAMGEISSAMTRMEGEKDYIKETLNDLSEKFQIPKKLLNRFSRVYHKQNYSDELGANSDFETLVEILVNPTATTD